LFDTLSQDRNIIETMNQAVSPNPRFLEIDGVVNFRDLGGYATQDKRSVRWGLIYRAGQLDRPSAHGTNSLKALNIATVVDLRFSEETERSPTDWQAMPDARRLAWQQFYFQEGNQVGAAKTITLSWQDALETGDVHAVRDAMRDNYPTKLYSHKGVYRAMLDSLIEGNVPLVFHCAAGKDRTGVGAAIILALLGVSYDDIIEDYLLTQQVTENLYERFRAGGATSHEGHSDFQQRLANYPQALVAPVFDADPSYITTLLDYVDNKYQTFAHYAEQVLDFGTPQVEQLKAKLLVG